ncbi:DUF3995 domain-containing protein [Paenibacillus tarimensis]|uniref:DUF3995 domain-containing protein n=1 Tax=Paenibacillus tarimensis TaxID=416012 RepID=UPI001F1AAC8C|nr:DUF3995 domain-containing protein [Paenibacillus tarimensis]MCF2945755.1 DUF3995 domain-containing protein [Paenibacillus tarimensis]
MVALFTWIVSSILIVLSGVHVYWMLGGRKGVRAAIPSDNGGRRFHPSKAATGVVALALASSGWFTLELGRMFHSSLFPGWLLVYGGWGLSLVFILRAVGDFRWMGFFKTRKGTLFAEWDSILFTPLCLFLGLSLGMITMFR